MQFCSPRRIAGAKSGWASQPSKRSWRIVAPGLLDRYLAKVGYSGQLTREPLPAEAPANLFEPVPGDYGAHGRFDAKARSVSWEMFTDRHRDALLLTGAAAMALLALRGLAPSRHRRPARRVGLS